MYGILFFWVVVAAFFGLFTVAMIVIEADEKKRRHQLAEIESRRVARAHKELETISAELELIESGQTLIGDASPARVLWLSGSKGDLHLHKRIGDDIIDKPLLPGRDVINEARRYLGLHFIW